MTTQIMDPSLENNDVNDVPAPVVSINQTAQDIAASYSNKKFAWAPLLFISGVHIAALAAFFTFSWKALAVCLVLHWMTGGLGITLGYHRLLTHRSFKVAKPLEYLLAIIGCMACQGGPVKWVVAHRLHHAYSDNEGDPHSPVKSFFWSHIGWCLYQNDVLDNAKEYKRFAPDLANDPIMVWLDRTNIIWTILLGALLYAWGGWPFVVWGIFVRIVLVYHATWFVNSAAHVWGYQTYRSSDQSRNLWWVALMTYGEGWHNNHHAFQYSARHGLRWWEIDTTYMTVKFLEFFGLAKDLKIPSARLLQEKQIR